MIDFIKSFFGLFLFCIPAIIIGGGMNEIYAKNDWGKHGNLFTVFYFCVMIALVIGATMPWLEILRKYYF